MANKALSTPVGVFKYCHLNKPDTRYKDEGEYSVNVVFDRDEPAVQAMLKTLEAKHEEAVADAEAKFDELPAKTKAKLKTKKITGPDINPFYEEEYDENDQPTGNIILKFKTKAQFQDRKTGAMTEKVVTLVDGKGQVIPKAKRPLVYAGTTGRVQFGVGGYFIGASAATGLSFYLNKVQIKELVTAGSGGASGFDEIEDSDFSADDLEEYEAPANEGETPADDLDDDLDVAPADDLDDEIPF